jgi:hypothetical protein
MDAMGARLVLFAARMAEACESLPASAAPIRDMEGRAEHAIAALGRLPAPVISCCTNTQNTPLNAVVKCCANRVARGSRSPHQPTVAGGAVVRLEHTPLVSVPPVGTAAPRLIGTGTHSTLPDLQWVLRSWRRRPPPAPIALGRRPRLPPRLPAAPTPACCR